MQRTSLAFVALVLAACAPSDKKETETAPALVPATLDISTLAGKWSQAVRPLDSDSVIITTELVAGPDAASWTLHMPGREPQPVRVTVDADSVMTSAGPYASVLRQGAMVTTTGVMRLVGDKLIGTTTARYTGGGADSVVTLRTESTRVP